MTVDVLTDDQFVIPKEAGAPVCPTCGGALWVEVDERDEKTGVPTMEGVLVSCLPDSKRKRPRCVERWDYGHILNLHGQVERWCEKEAMAKRRWELALWGESQIPDLENCY